MNVRKNVCGENQLLELPLLYPAPKNLTIYLDLNTVVDYPKFLSNTRLERLAKKLKFLLKMKRVSDYI